MSSRVSLESRLKHLSFSKVYRARLNQPILLEPLTAQSQGNEHEACTCFVKTEFLAIDVSEDLDEQEDNCIATSRQCRETVDNWLGLEGALELLTAIMALRYLRKGI